MLIDTLRRSLGTVLVYQGVMTVGVLIALPYVLDAFDINQIHLNIFRVAAVAAVFHVLLLVLLVILLYFDFRKSVMWLSICFFSTNAIFTWATFDKGQESLYGWGYLVATALTLFLRLPRSATACSSSSSSRSYSSPSAPIRRSWLADSAGLPGPRLPEPQ